MMIPNVSFNTLAKMIDHSLLHPTLSDSEILKGFEIARKYEIAAVCVKPYAVKIAKETLKGSKIGICSVISFPHGNSTTSLKVAESEQAIADGANEIDIVINIGKALSGDWLFISNEIEAINEACVRKGALVKVIFETDYLNDEQIIKLCQICSKLKVAFVKTSTGYGFVKQANGDYNYQGATEYILKLMRQHCAPEVQLKASGGIRTLEQLLKARDLGCTRCGTTATENILEEAKKHGFK